ncbi:MAG: VCBS repeat-containing protein [Acidobacteriota bacterium]
MFRNLSERCRAVESSRVGLVLLVVFAACSVDSSPAALRFTIGAGPGSVVVADVNGDGKLDIATANAESDNATVLLGDGKAGFVRLRIRR